MSKPTIRPIDLKRIEAALTAGRELAAQQRQDARDLHVHLDTLAAAVNAYRQAELPFDTATPKRLSRAGVGPGGTEVAPAKRARARKTAPVT